MPPWDGKFSKTKMNFAGGKLLRVLRCRAVVQTSGGGYPGPHQCTLTAIIEVNGQMLCATHLRQHLRKSAAE